MSIITENLFKSYTFLYDGTFLTTVFLKFSLTLPGLDETYLIPQRHWGEQAAVKLLMLRTS